MEKHSERTREAYFAAANGRDGFRSYFSECFENPEIQKLYVIKGAPGTGKSKFMKDVSALAEAKGGKVDYYYCSSDPESLDGITVRLPSHTLAVIDATLPHGYEPRLPGVRDVIVDLGAFWNSDVLDAYREEIVRLNDEKKYRFDMAYKYLRAAAQLDNIAFFLASRYADTDKIKRRAKKLLHHVPRGNGYSAQYGLVDSIGMLGQFRLGTLTRLAERVWYVDDFCSLGSILLDEIHAEAKQKGLSVILSPDPLVPERLSALYIRETKSAFIISKKDSEQMPDAKRIDMRRLACHESHRLFSGKAKLATRLSRELIDSACEEFERARFYHFELERIYGSAMDFDAKEKFTKQFAKGILKT
jgi:energy-coupling factor transporter ATP-binding protein EcfA2